MGNFIEAKYQRINNIDQEANLAQPSEHIEIPGLGEYYVIRQSQNPGNWGHHASHIYLARTDRWPDIQKAVEMEYRRGARNALYFARNHFSFWNSDVLGSIGSIQTSGYHISHHNRSVYVGDEIKVGIHINPYFNRQFLTTTDPTESIFEDPAAMDILSRTLSAGYHAVVNDVFEDITALRIRGELPRVPNNLWFDEKDPQSAPFLPIRLPLSVNITAPQPRMPLVLLRKLLAVPSSQGPSAPTREEFENEAIPNPEGKDYLSLQQPTDAIEVQRTEQSPLFLYVPTKPLRWNRYAREEVYDSNLNGELIDTRLVSSV